MAQDQDAYLLSGQSVKALAEMKRWWERNARNYHPPKYRRPTIRGASTVGWIGILQGSLAYGSSASVKLYSGTAGSETAGSTVTCYPWMMNTGDSIATNTEVVGCVISGYYYVFNAACKNVYGS